MQINTRKLAPTDMEGARIKVTVVGGREQEHVIPWSHQSINPHYDAALAMAKQVCGDHFVSMEQIGETATGFKFHVTTKAED